MARSQESSYSQKMHQVHMLLDYTADQGKLSCNDFLAQTAAGWTRETCP